MTKLAEGQRPVTGVGQPAYKKLHLFAELVEQAFPGCEVYLTGTAAVSKEWRDVDVRCVLPGPLYRRYAGDQITTERIARAADAPQHRRSAALHDENLSNVAPLGRRRGALELAFSALAHEMTGLPVDFQLMSRGYERWCGYHDHYAERIGRRVV